MAIVSLYSCLFGAQSAFPCDVDAMFSGPRIIHLKSEKSQNLTDRHFPDKENTVEGS